MNVMPAARHFLSRLRTRRAPAAIEPADYGTAFGLELTYDEAPAPDSLPTDSASSAGSGWWHRLRNRGAPQA